ncbi:hypothetical protein M441DRAFT_236417 [Trichoderma asperellum CBS 433.97]|uniref:Uncharacterized protein n=1 Tax=Trichoderma asperellum (strain ATCC 204424 / CBS 433.97 / NBRC 101777) TaxID=1042311 RepID=A0A2T3Z1G6_TRIA4|nr:hypothetical protein M441DRAFT_236417 [Trichoderma asperellum CBS 433.97]PTB38642.1 hypothetical protein M441DRAFT_236417 [Trichoderma asperellum CBS 433.97]
MPYNLVLRQSFLPLDSVRLGRLVLNVEEPQQDYFDAPCDNAVEPLIKPHIRYNEVQHTAADQKFASILTRLVSASRTKRNKTYTQVTTDRAMTYQLRNSGLWFKNALQDESTRKWLEEAIDQGDDVYLIVGYHTLLDARILEGAAAMTESHAKVEVPVTASLAAAGAAVIPLGDIADPKISGLNRQEHSAQRQFVASGEQVVALQYRKVRFKWYSSREMDNAFLDDNRWKVYWDMRGQEETVNDVLEVELQDELELDSDYKKCSSLAEDDFLY